MCSLADFPLPCENQVPLCELDGKVQCSTPDFINLHLYTNCVTNHPKVVITKDVLQQSLAKLFPGEAFLPSSDPLLQRLQDAWYEAGVDKVLETLANQNNTVLKYIGKYLLTLQRAYKQGLIYTRCINNEFEQKKSSEAVVCMAWHPHCTKLAVATRDDTVTVYSTNSGLTPILKAKAQRRITCIAWRPLTSGELAVACSSGVYIWTIDPNSVISRPSFGSTVLLPDKYITSICWSPQGDVLMSCNGRDALMTAWDPESKRSIPLKRGGGGGVSQLSWSPDGSKLLASTVTRIFRVWNCANWTYETWLTVSGNVSTSVWSSSGSYLLFTTTSEHCLYCLPSSQHIFKNQQNGGSYLVADLARVQMGSYIAGGEVKGMTWDKHNRHLAIMFHDSPVIAIFYTSVTPHFQIYPGFFIIGINDEMPSYICFQNNFDQGSNLTICWSSGRVQYFPIIFSTQEYRAVTNASNTVLTPTIGTILTPTIGDRTGHYFSFSSP